APALVAWAEMPATAPSNAPSRTEVDRAKLFDAVVETIERYFVDTDRLAAVDWQGRAREVRPSVLAAATTEEAVSHIRKLLAELKLSHTELTTPDEERYYITLDVFGDFRQIEQFNREKFWGSNPYYPGVGIFTAGSDGKYFIDGVL